VPSSQKLASSSKTIVPRHSAAFFDRGQPYFHPLLLGLSVGARKQLARTLHRKPEAVKQSGDVLLVVADAEVVFDPVLHHRSVPHASRESRCLRTCLDDLLELLQLLVGHAARRAGRGASPEPLHALHVVPADPLLDGGQRHIQIDRHLRHRPALEVAQHCAPSAPRCQVRLRLGLSDELPELFEFLRCSLRVAYRMAIA